MPRNDPEPHHAPVPTRMCHAGHAPHSGRTSGRHVFPNAGGGARFRVVQRRNRPTASSIDAGRRIPDDPSCREDNMIRKIGRQAASFANVGIAAALLVLVAGGVHAFTAPTAGDLGYDIYDIVVNQGVKGPLGFVAGVAAFLFGVSRLFSNIMIGIPTIVAAVCLIKADSILQTFGMVI